MKPSKARKGAVKVVASFRHWRTGEIIKAADYGHKGFPIPSTKRRAK